MPPRLEDEAMKDALRVLAQPHSIFFKQLLEGLFAPSRVHVPPAERATRRQSSLDPAGGEAASHYSPLLLQDPSWMIAFQRLQDNLASVFRRHGAISLPLPPVWLKQHAPATAVADENVAYLLDPTGALLGLHSGGRHPLIQYLAANPPLATLKRYTFSHAMRRNPTGALPREMLLADFDIVLPTTSAPPLSPLAHGAAAASSSSSGAGASSTTSAASWGSAAAAAAATVEAELIKVAHEVLLEAGVPVGGSEGASAVMQLGHRELTAGLLRVCGVLSGEEAQLKTALAKAAARRADEWSDERRGGRSLCTAEVSSKIQKYFYHECVQPRGTSHERSPTRGPIAVA